MNKDDPLYGDATHIRVRIATYVMGAMASPHDTPEQVARKATMAVANADALLAELRK